MYSKYQLLTYLWFQSFHQLSNAILAAKSDSKTTTKVLNIAQSSINYKPTTRSDQEVEPEFQQVIEDVIMTSVEECCPCLSKRCTCSFVTEWKASKGYRTWRLFRYRLKRLVEHKFFEWVVILVILVSSFVLVSVILLESLLLVRKTI